MLMTNMPRSGCFASDRPPFRPAPEERNRIRRPAGPLSLLFGVGEWLRNNLLDRDNLHRIHQLPEAALACGPVHQAKPDRFSATPGMQGIFYFLCRQQDSVPNVSLAQF